MKTETQREWVKKQLLAGKKLTQLEVTLEKQILRLGAIIHYLRHVVDMQINVELKQGKGSGMYAVYYMTAESIKSYKQKEKKCAKK